MKLLYFILAMVISVSAAYAADVTLAWDPNTPDVDGYRLYRRVDGQQYTAPVWTGTALTCTIAVADGVLHYFVVRAFKGTVESDNSNEVSYCGGCVPPKIVTNITIKREDGKMFLIADPAPASSVDYYDVELNGQVTRSDPERAGDQVRLHHDLSGISMGQHTARIRAVGEWGEGPWSDPFGFSAELPGAVSGVGLSAE